MSLKNYKRIGDVLIVRVLPVMELLSRSSSSNQGFGSLPPADHSWRSRLEPELSEDQNVPGLFFSQNDEAFRTETLRMLLHSVGEAEGSSSQSDGFILYITRHS